MWLAVGFQTCLAAMPGHDKNNETTAITAIQHQVSSTSECPPPLCHAMADADQLAYSNNHKWTNLKDKALNNPTTYTLFNTTNTIARKLAATGLADFSFPHPNTLYNILRI